MTKTKVAPFYLGHSVLTAQATYRANQAITAQRAATACLIMFKLACLYNDLQHGRLPVIDVMTYTELALRK